MRKSNIKKKNGQKYQLPKGEYGFCIGNGTSRKDLDVKQLMDHGIVYACNWFFKKEFRPHVLVASDEPITKTIQKVHERYSRANWFYTFFPKKGSGAKLIKSPEKFAAGPSSAFIAASEHQCSKVFLIGNDFFGFDSPKDLNNPDSNGVLNNLYEGEKHYAKPPKEKDAVNGAPTWRNWQRRFLWIMKNFPETEFWHVNPFDGASPPRFYGMDNFFQCDFSNLVDHLKNDAELVNIKPKPTPEQRKLSYGDNPDDFKACIERQLAGQENIIFPDQLPPQQCFDIRRQALAEQRKLGQDGKNLLLQMELGGQVITVPFMGYIENGHVKYPSDEELAGAYEAELKIRGIPEHLLQQLQEAAPDIPPPPPPPGVRASPGLPDLPPPPPPVGGNNVTDLPPPPPPPVVSNK